ncbi:hypothetical protein [Streptomyces sp. NPDC096030]|uniref:hypothetical protein n=1 Tax=Streptomyces sp. NPDC096030 TaxID=3155423 RepID=UPI0033241776
MSAGYGRASRSKASVSVSGLSSLASLHRANVDAARAERLWREAGGLERAGGLAR